MSGSSTQEGTTQKPFKALCTTLSIDSKSAYMGKVTMYNPSTKKSFRPFFFGDDSVLWCENEDHYTFTSVTSDSKDRSGQSKSNQDGYAEPQKSLAKLIGQYSSDKRKDRSSHYHRSIPKGKFECTVVGFEWPEDVIGPERLTEIPLVLCEFDGKGWDEASLTTAQRAQGGMSDTLKLTDAMKRKSERAEPIFNLAKKLSELSDFVV